MPRGRTAVVVCSLAVVACSSSPPPPAHKPASVTVADASAPSSIGAAAPPPAPRRAAIWLPGADFVDIGGGRRGAVIRHRRAVFDGTQTTLLDDNLPTGLGRARRVPETLGGGWLFVDDRSLAYAKTFDGPLVSFPLGETGQIGFGIERVLVRGTTYELATAKPAPALVPDAVQLFGLPSGQVAARTKNGDVHLSTAKGKPFAKVASGAEMIAYDGKGFVLQSRTGQKRLTLDGKIAPLDSGPGVTSSDNLLAFDFPDLSKPPPKAPDVDRMIGPLTIAMDDGHVLRVDEHDLVVYDGQKGVQAAVQKDAFADRESCFPLRGGTPAFVACNGANGMDLFRVDAFDQPPVLERSIPRVASLDFGFPYPSSALVFAGRCDATPAPGTFCVRRDEKTWSEVAANDPQNVIASAPFMAGVLASKDGVPYGFAWQNGNGPLIVVDGQTRAVRVIPKTDIPEWAQHAIRWQTVSVSDGRVRFLLEGNHAGVMTIDSDGKVEVKPLTGHLAAVGARGLLVTPDGKLTATVDGGRSWQEIEPPPGGADAKSLQCSEGGCTVGPWRRLGW